MAARGNPGVWLGTLLLILGVAFIPLPGPGIMLCVIGAVILIVSLSLAKKR